jgi:hypothetical protein
MGDPAGTSRFPVPMVPGAVALRTFVPRKGGLTCINGKKVIW